MGPGAADGGGEEASDLLVRARVDLWRRRGEPSRAADALADLAERPGAGRSDLLRELIDLYAAADRPEDALAAVARWKETSPGSLTPWLREATLLEAAGRDEDALQTLVAAGRRFPDDATVGTTLATAYASRGNTAEAARVYWRLYDDAESDQAKVSRATQLAELTRWTDQGRRVIEQLEERREAAPGEVGPLLALAEVYRVLDRYEERRQALTEAARIQPDDVNLLLALAQTDEERGDPEGAAATLRRALPLDPSGRIRQRLAALYVELGETERGFALLESAAAPADADAVLAFANALAGDARWEEAAGFLGRHAERFADDYRVGYVRGVVLTEVMNDQAMDAARSAFLAVLDATEEPPGVTAPPSDPMMRGWLASFQEVLPAGAMDLLQQLMQQQQAQMHRMQAMHGGAFTGIAPPTRLEDAHAMAVAQLRSLGQQLDEEERASLTAELVDRDVPKAELLMAMPADGMNAFAPGPEVAEAFPDDADLLAVQLLVSGFGEGDMEIDRVDRAIETFEADHPVLAMMARMGRFARLQAEGAPAEEIDAALGADRHAARGDGPGARDGDRDARAAALRDPRRAGPRRDARRGAAGLPRRPPPRLVRRARRHQPDEADGADDAHHRRGGERGLGGAGSPAHRRDAGAGCEEGGPQRDAAADGDDDGRPGAGRDPAARVPARRPHRRAARGAAAARRAEHVRAGARARPRGGAGGAAGRRPGRAPGADRRGRRRGRRAAGGARAGARRRAADARRAAARAPPGRSAMATRSPRSTRW